MSRSKNLYFWLLTFSIISAFGVHVYLANLHFDLKVGNQAVNSICDVSGNFNCQSSLASPFSEFLGTPLSIWALGLHLLLLGNLLAYRFPIIGLGGQSINRWMVRITASAIFAASLVMLGISIFALGSFCPVCVSGYVISLLTLIFSFLVTREEEPERPPRDAFLRWVAYSGVFFIAFGFLGGRVVLSNLAGAGHSALVRSAVLEWQTARPQSTPKVEAAVVGSTGDDFVVTEFADFLCGFCKNAAQRLEAFVQSRSDVKFEFYSFPLDGECNPAVGSSHGLSCKLAYIAYCAYEQTKDLSPHMWIFDHQDEFRRGDSVENLTSEMSAELKLDQEILNQCSASEEVKELIRAQAEMGQKWGVNGTPAIYVNSKRLPNGPILPFLEAVYSR